MPFHPCHDRSGLLPLRPWALPGENCCAPLDIIWPNSAAIWFIVALLYGWSIHSTQLQVGPQLQVWSAAAPLGLNFITGKSGGGWNCWIGVKGAALIDSVLMWPLLSVSFSDFTPPPQQEDTAAGADAATGNGGIGAA